MKKVFSYLTHTYKSDVWFHLTGTSIMRSRARSTNKFIVRFIPFPFDMTEQWPFTIYLFCSNLFRANATVIIHRVNIFIHLNTCAIFYFKTDATTWFFVVSVRKRTRSPECSDCVHRVLFQLWISRQIKLSIHQRLVICHILTVLSCPAICNQRLHL